MQFVISSSIYIISSCVISRSHLVRAQGSSRCSQSDGSVLSRLHLLTWVRLYLANNFVEAVFDQLHLVGVGEELVA